ncbi:MAG: class I adenylate-forming enzyme family protein [Planctomycetota bacterium]|nr:class I adenylate-forming enzyme family protein [Planctomycetota bacterium]
MAPAASHASGAAALFAECDKTGVARWRAVLHAALRGRSHPVLVFPEATTTAASLWAASRLWVALFRSHGVRAGDRVVLSRGPDAGFLAFLAAALWEGLTVAVVPPGSEEGALEFFDARLMLGRGALDADGAGCPLGNETLRSARGPAHADVRLLLRSSGTSGRPTWAALSDDNLWSVLDSHEPCLAGARDAVLSVLPWHHAFGLVLDVLPALLRSRCVVRESSQGRDAASMIRAASEWKVSWCSMVPLQAERLAMLPDGPRMLRRLRGGVVGGAPVSRHLADVLRGSSLRVGYGQTEASPGVAVGEPGDFEPGCIGLPRGCETRVDSRQSLLVRGRNVCIGTWTSAGLERLAPDRWLDTGDMVSCRAGRTLFAGRADSSFKLANGRMVHSPLIEQALREADGRLVDAAVVPSGSDRIRVFLVFNRADEEPDINAVKRALGALSDRLESVQVRAEGPALRTPKGALDRVRLLAA